MNDLVALVLFVGPLVGAIGTLLLVRWPRVAGLVGTAVAGLLWFLLRFWYVEGASITILGQELLLAEDFQTVLLTIYAGVGTLFFIAAWLSQGTYFVPSSLLALAPLAVAGMVQSTSFGALSLLVAACILTITLQGDSAGDTKAALRYLMMFVLALPLFIVADWFAGQNQLLSAERLLLFGAMIVSAGFPFYIWIRPLVLTAPPLALSLIFGLVQLVVVYFIFAFLQVNTLAQPDLSFVQVIWWSGAITIIVAVLFVVLAPDWRHLWTGLLLMEMGLSLFLFTAANWETAVTVTIARFVSLTIGGCGFSLLKSRGYGDEPFANLRGEGRRFPLAWGLLSYGFLSLLGVPLTVGFQGRWLILTAVAQTTFPSIWIILFILLALFITAGIILWRFGQLWDSTETAVGSVS